MDCQPLPDGSGGESRLMRESAAMAFASIVSRNCAWSSTFHTSVGNIGMTSEASFHRSLCPGMLKPTRSSRGRNCRPASSCLSIRALGSETDGWPCTQLTLSAIGVGS
jgi:hypothetical protein